MSSLQAELKEVHTAKARQKEQTLRAIEAAVADHGQEQMAAAVVQREFRKGKSKADKRALTKAGVEKTGRLEAQRVAAERQVEALGGQVEGAVAAQRLGVAEAMGLLWEQHACSLVALAEFEEALQAHEEVLDDVSAAAAADEDEWQEEEGPAPEVVAALIGGVSPAQSRELIEALSRDLSSMRQQCARLGARLQTEAATD